VRALRCAEADFSLFLFLPLQLLAIFLMRKNFVIMHDERFVVCESTCRLIVHKKRKEKERKKKVFMYANDGYVYKGV